MKFLQYLSLVGQVFEIIGAAILFKYGIPPYTPKYEGAVITHDGGNPPEKKAKTEIYSRMNKIGFGFILVGFLLQSYQTVCNIQCAES